MLHDLGGILALQMTCEKMRPKLLQNLVKIQPL